MGHDLNNVLVQLLQIKQLNEKLLYFFFTVVTVLCSFISRNTVWFFAETLCSPTNDSFKSQFL